MPDNEDLNLPWKTYKVSKSQLKTLVERAGPDAVSAALIQNGSTPTEFNHFDVSKRQLQVLIERAGPDAVSAALIQNGNDPG